MLIKSDYVSICCKAYTRTKIKSTQKGLRKSVLICLKCKKEVRDLVNKKNILDPEASKFSEEDDSI